MMKILMFLVSFVFVVFSVQAADTGYSSTSKRNMFTSENKPHIGLLAGVTVPEGEGDETAEVGVDIGYQPLRNYGFGAEFTNATVDTGVEDVARNTLLLKALYHFGEETMIRYGYLGLGAGAVFVSDDTLEMIAPIAGFDVPVTSQDTEYITLGANARYNVIADETDAFTLSGAVKYWY
jgi:hypothetical protein